VGVGLRFTAVTYLGYIFSSATLEAQGRKLNQNFYTFGREYYFENARQNAGYHLPQNWYSKTTYFRLFPTTWQPNGKFKGQYFWNENDIHNLGMLMET